MWKLKVSKFKNAAPKMPKKEDVISDLGVGSVGASSGNHIKASTSYIAFNTETAGGGDIGILPIDAIGRQSRPMPVIRAHAEAVTDFDFSRANGCLLATGSHDCSVKTWLLRDDPGTSVQECISQGEHRIECVLWHPLADTTLATAANNTVSLYDTSTSTLKYECSDHSDVVHSICWSQDGQLLASTSKDKKLRVLDPRNNQIVQTGTCHGGVKESRVQWVNNQNILTTGFDTMRQREVKIFDSRNLSVSLNTLSLDTNTGIILPLYDADTNMLFLAGKGDTSIRYLEVTDKDPYLTQASVDTVEQMLGACLVPRLCLDVMSCEVNRMLLLTKQAIIPLPYKVPRKSYTEFHEDLFPSTANEEASMSCDQWWGGANTPATLISLDPRARKTAATKPTPSKPVTNVLSTPANKMPAKPTAEPTPQATPPVLQSPSGDAARSQDNQQDPVPSQVIPAKPKPFSGVRQSKFRHLVGKPLHKSLHIDNIRNLSRSIPGESDFFHANVDRCVLPLAGQGGLLSVLELSKPGKLPDTGIPVIENGSTVCDFMWSPFDNTELAVACDDAKIRVWWVPDDGLTETLTEPDVTLLGHTEKIYFLLYHPLAKDVLLSASYDMTVRLWNISEAEEILQLEGHTDQIFCAAWSSCGEILATVCKDGKLRIYDPRTSTEPVQVGCGPEGPRGARVVWVCHDSCIAVTGFDKSSLRMVKLFSSSDITQCLCTSEINVSPSILIPYYDADSTTLFLTGRGDSTVYTFEVCNEEPYLFPLSPYKADGLHQALSFLPKCQCNVREVEFAKAYRLTQSSIEPISFTVPRVKTEYFQDDLFPETRQTWLPALGASEWFQGINRQQQHISIRPDHMKLLSEAPAEAPKPHKYESYNPEVYKTDEMKREELLAAMTSKLGTHDEPLPQDLTEGVDEDEWDD